MKNNIIKKDIILSVQNYLNKYLVLKKSKILIAFSGGPDSIMLAEVLSALKEEMNFKLTCIYINHGLRSSLELIEELNNNQNYCDSKNINLIIKNIASGKIIEEVKLTGKSIEELARDYRYSFFEDELKNYDYLATGHNLDDQMETMMMRFFQGSGPGGLKGIPEKRNKIIRPLYFVEKNLILDTLKDLNISYNTDLSNFENKYLRNKIRNKLIPVVNDIFPDYKKTLLNLKDKFDDVNVLIKNELSRHLWVKDLEGFKIAKDEFLSMPVLLRIESILNLFPEKKERIPYSFFNTIKYNENIKANNRILLKGYGIKVFTKGNCVFSKRDVVHTIKKSYLNSVCFEGSNIVNSLYVIDLTDGLVKYSDFNGIYIRKEDIVKPLVVRSKKISDKIKIKSGYKTVKKLFNEWQVPEDKRWEIPILEDRTEIIAVLGKVVGYDNFISDNFNKSGNENLSICIRLYGDFK